MTDTASPPQEAAPAYAPDFLHELLWEQIKRMFSEELIAAGAKMGTVSAITTVGLSVLVDGTSAPRNMPRVAGRSFAIGQRVVVAKVQGKPVVVGGVLTSASGTPVIGTADIIDGAITAAKINSSVSLMPPDRSLTYIKMAVGGLRGSAVDGDQSIFVQGSIGTRDIGPNAITSNKIGDGEVTNLKIGSVAASKITGRISSDQIGALPGAPGVLGGNIGDLAVGNRNLQDDSVDARVLGPFVVGTAQIQGGGDGQPGAVTWQKLDPALQAMIGKKKKNRNAQGQVTSVYYVPERPRHSDDD